MTATRRRRPTERLLDWLDGVGDFDRCWEYTGADNGHGYGQVYLDGRRRVLHRWMYEQATKTPIPDDMVVDHICRTRRCANPLHLRVVTTRQNVVDYGVGVTAVNASKTHCIRGHEFTPENTCVNKTHGGRSCRECRRAYERTRPRKSRAKAVA